MKLLMLADDLTGAMDSSVFFAQLGADTKVYLTPELSPADWKMLSEGKESPEVVCINTESRHLPPAEAAAIVFKLARTAAAEKIPYIYKKTDSALRGNVGAELEAFRQGLGLKVLPFVPAHPRLNRILRKGILYIDKVPVNETALGRDPFNPVRFCRAEDILRDTSPEIRIAESLMGEGIRILNGETTEDLQLAGKLLEQEGYLRALAGCGGFAETIAKLLYPVLDNSSEAAEKGIHIDAQGSGSLRKGLLVVSGSLHEQSLKQLKKARKQGHAVFWAGDEILEPLGRELAATGIGIFSGCMLREDTGEPVLSLSMEEAGERIASAAHEAIEKLKPEAVCVFGGDTLTGILKTFGVRSLMVQRELFPGVILGSFELPDGDRLSVVTKAGSFGEEDLIEKLSEIFNCRKTEQ